MKSASIVGKRIVLAFLVISCFLVSACASLVRPNYSTALSELRSGEYTLDTEHAYIIFKIGHLGLSSIVGRFNVVTGTLDFDPENIESMVLQGIIEADSIDVNNAELEDTLLEKAWFDAQTFPQISFASTSVTRDDSDGLLVTGELQMRGISREIVLKTKFNGGADNFLTGKYTLGFTANTQINRSDFGMDAFAALVADEVEVELYGEFQRN